MDQHLKVSTYLSTSFVEATSSDCLVLTAQDMLDIAAWGGERGVRSVLLDVTGLSRKFFDLSSGLAGEILQKCSTYGICLAISGDYTDFMSSRFPELVSELNRGRQVRFFPTREAAVRWFNDVSQTT